MLRRAASSSRNENCRLHQRRSNQSPNTLCSPVQIGLLCRTLKEFGYREHWTSGQHSRRCSSSLENAGSGLATRSAVLEIPIAPDVSDVKAGPIGPWSNTRHSEARLVSGTGYRPAYLESSFEAIFLSPNLPDLKGIEPCL